MSLSWHLRNKNSPINQFLQEQFPNTKAAPFLVDARKQLRAAETIWPNAVLSRTDLSAIGIAMDYRLRYYFDVTPVEKLIAFVGAFFLGGSVGGPAPRSLIGLTDIFFFNLENFTSQCQPVSRRLPAVEEDVLNSYCVVLALFEQVFRGGISPNSPLVRDTLKDVDDLLGLAESLWLDDMRRLSWSFYDGLNHLLELPHILNPTFDGSVNVGGADADLIVDGTLIDIKTSIKPQIAAYFIRQLLGYALLDYSNHYHIDNIGLYMSRQGILFKWGLDEVIAALCPGQPPSIAELRAKFQEVVNTYRQSRMLQRESSD